MTMMMTMMMTTMMTMTSRNARQSVVLQAVVKQLSVREADSHE
jgi:hypothetical protein